MSNLCSVVGIRVRFVSRKSLPHVRKMPLIEVEETSPLGAHLHRQVSVVV